MSQLDRDIRCDHTSVGMLVWKDDRLLLIERRRFPFGFAPPAGHVDGDLSFELAAKRELGEEVGLKTKNLKLLFEANINNNCRRKEGSWHHWKVYEVEAEGDVKRCDSETIKAEWFTSQAMKRLAQRTEAYIEKKITEEEWEESPGLELVWLEVFHKIGLV
jgi:ADP-ribose pyrophosphatase YjhB (NUDIX family)